MDARVDDRNRLLDLQLRLVEVQLEEAAMRAHRRFVWRGAGLAIAIIAASLALAVNLVGLFR